jgi:G3E family GTPase
MPDLVIVEASGAADPARVLDALPHYHGRPLLSVHTVSVVDPLRLPVLIEVMTPLVTSQIEHANTIVISKTDLSGRDQVDLAFSIVRKINQKADILRFSGRGTLESELLRGLLP